LDLEKNTMVVFTSDNGPANWQTYDRGWPEEWPLTLIGSAGVLRGHKAQLYEGGHREPFIICWPGELDSGRVFEHPVSTLDLFPTFLSAAGVQVSDRLYLDGVDLLPFIKGDDANPPNDTLYWMTHRQGAVRAGDWKLLIESDTAIFLYNVKEDLSESKDLADAYPEIADRLLESWKNWSAPFPVSASEQKKFVLRE
jgi:arylsulfatase A-like enzyme